MNIPARLQLGGFIRRYYGELFSVKVPVVKRNANHSLSLTLMEPHGQALQSPRKTADKKHGV